MKDKFTMLIMTFIVIAIFGVIGMFGVIIYNEINETDKSNALSEVAEFKTSSINTNDTVEKNIETPKIIEKNPLDELSKNNIENSENDVNYDNIVVNKFITSKFNYIFFPGLPIIRKCISYLEHFLKRSPLALHRIYN